MKTDPRLWLGRLALAGPIAFTVAWLFGGLAQDDYSVQREDISALAALDAQHAWIMITGFLLLGAGTVALGAGLMMTLKGRRTVIGSILVLIAGVGLVVAGLARNDCSGELSACAERVDAGDVSWHSTVHDTVSLVVFLALIGASLVLAGSFRRADHWRDLRSYSIVTGLLGFVLLVIFVTGAAGSWSGVLQRVFVSVLFLWIALLGLRLTQLARARPGQPDPREHDDVITRSPTSRLTRGQDRIDM